MMILLLVTYSFPGNTQALPDPTRPAEYQATVVAKDLPKELIDWKLSAIRISDNDRSAILNGKIVRAGDVVGPATILKIQPLQVLLDYNNRQVAVRLFSEVVLRRQASNALNTEKPIK